MIRWLTGALIVGLFLCGVVLCGDVEARRKGEAAHVWWAPDSSWAVGGFGKHRPGLVEQILSMKPAELDGLKGYELMRDEPGEWLGFNVALKKVERVVFTRRTKIVLVDKAGRRLESEAIVFYPDRLQSAVYDNRKMAVVVSPKSMFCYGEGGQPSGMAKFPVGSIEIKNIVSFEVVGGVAQSGDGEAR
ncbi:MAG: hypothetical protein V2A71_07925 [Candidatus Eisenbacteria bacterium]